MILGGLMLIESVLFPQEYVYFNIYYKNKLASTNGAEATEHPHTKKKEKERKKDKWM